MRKLIIDNAMIYIKKENGKEYLLIAVEDLKKFGIDIKKIQLKSESGRKENERKTH
mgnify:CR=1 FL=1